jgi:hypothetical protein
MTNRSASHEGNGGTLASDVAERVESVFYCPLPRMAMPGQIRFFGVSMIRATRAVEAIGSIDDDEAILRLVREKGE